MKELIAIQSELKAPKRQYNSFGKYNYRSCEDILDAVKPLLLKHNCILLLTDKIVEVGGRYYVEATARLINSEGAEISVTASAREEETKKGMDASQITGSTSSYARKYALNGLFCIDDSKDADSLNNGTTTGSDTNNNKEQEALKAVTNCKTESELAAVFNKYKSSFTNQNTLVEACANRKKELRNESKAA